MREISAKTKRRVKKRLSAEKPTIWVGKTGVSQELLKEVDKQLDKNEMVKIKILKSALESSKTKEVAAQIAEQTRSSLVEVRRGNTFMLYKRRKK
ncbi:YhbY family RNA-binding protein [Candidatus Bathyarchaeota archaeon]|nr:MAG: YhbY family RNA-binding protein [Candidatus Bathyarchaeota archaeon]